MPKCLNCGKELKFTFREKIKKFCSDSCKNKYHSKLKSNKILHCLVCGKELEGRKRRYCSDECYHKAQLKRQRFLNEVEYKKSKAEVKEAPKKKRGRPKKKLSIADINKLARAEGLNYGQYVAKYGL